MHLPARLRTPRALLAAARFEARLRMRRARMERGLARGGPVVVGPWLSEIGFELLYWLPFLARRLEGVEPERVTVLSRGGAGAWYAHLATATRDVHELVDLPAFRDELRRREGDQKQLLVTAFDRGLLRRAGLEDAHLLHPLAMYSRLRYVWAGQASLAELERHCRFLPLPAGRAPAVELPPGFIAAKPYFSAVLPATTANRELVRAVLAELAEEAPVALLSTGLELDDHAEAVAAADGPPIISLAGRFSPADNLAAQTAIVARARVLVSTYGGPSYLATFLGLPSVSFLTHRVDNQVHREAARLAAQRLGAPPPVVLDVGGLKPAEAAARVRQEVAAALTAAAASQGGG